MDWAHPETWQVHSASSTEVEPAGQQEKRKTKEHLEKRSEGWDEDCEMDLGATPKYCPGQREVEEGGRQPMPHPGLQA